MSRQDVTELETQFVLRLPDEPAKHLRELLRTGANLKERCWIRLEQELRYGEVKLDSWLMHAKLVDLPTITESLKTIDNKSFYKTADVCQMLICKEEADQPSAEDESPNKGKKKDPFKVEKKYLWPHGITPPTKNIRKRRFRKTLKKKYVEAPEIEKEVKRLLRSDNDAVTVKWDIFSEEEENAARGEAGTSGNQTEKPKPETTTKKEKAKGRAEARAKKEQIEAAKNASADTSSNVDVERDIFGGAVSDSDEEMGSNMNPEMDDNDNSRFSEYDSRMTDSNSFQGGPATDSPAKAGFPTHFASDMFNERRWSATSTPTASAGQSRATTPHGNSNMAMAGSSSVGQFEDTSDSSSRKRDSVQFRLEQLSAELESLRSQRSRKEQEVANMDNLTLKQRFQEILQNLIQEINQKEKQYQELQSQLQ